MSLGKKKISIITFFVVTLIIIALIISLVVTTSVQAYYVQMRVDGEVLAGNYSSQYSICVNSYIDRLGEELGKIADKVSGENDLNKVLKYEEDGKDNLSIERYGKFGWIFYAKDGVFYDSASDMQNNFDQGISNALATKKTTFAKFKRPDGDVTHECIAICRYISGREDCQMLVGFMSYTNFQEEVMQNLFTQLGDMPEMDSIQFCKPDGVDLEEFVKDGTTFKRDERTEKEKVLKDRNVYKLILDNRPDVTKEQIENSLTTKNYFSSAITVSSKDYVVSVVSPSLTQNNILISVIYPIESIVDVQNNFISIIIMSILFLSLIVFLLALLGVRYRKAWINKMEDAENYEPLTGCNSYKMFKNKLTELMTKNRYSKYAIIYFTLTQFDILYENYGDTVTNDILSFCGKVVSKSIDYNETYGHISTGKFVIAIHYKDLVDLNNRLGIIYALIHNYNRFESVDYTLSFTAGVYLAKVGERPNPELFLSNAIVAERSIDMNSRVKFYALYDEKVDEARQNEREIELRKEQAIANREFQVYYQPKLNLTTNNIDGAEALVRWYYPETDTLYSPAKFMPIFELDGFIEKVDRYVYLEVLDFLKRMVDSGRKVCPISVNVSRFTALQPDFLTFYIENKKKYGIADGYICVEFTENFAFDNNEKLRDIVIKLRENGMHCSIDDFGVGYSSYSILKDLPMDEVKLDALFMRSGYDPERDKKTLCSIIKLGKDLGMKVTQEGVESLKDKEDLKSYGCDVIQGYCYSRPIPSTAFEQFLMERLGSHGKRPKPQGETENKTN